MPEYQEDRFAFRLAVFGYSAVGVVTWVLCFLIAEKEWGIAGRGAMIVLAPIGLLVVPFYAAFALGDWAPLLVASGGTFFVWLIALWISEADRYAHQQELVQRELRRERERRRQEKARQDQLARELGLATNSGTIVQWVQCPSCRGSVGISENALGHVCCPKCQVVVYSRASETSPAWHPAPAAPSWMKPWGTTLVIFGWAVAAIIALAVMNNRAWTGTESDWLALLLMIALNPLVFVPLPLGYYWRYRAMQTASVSAPSVKLPPARVIPPVETSPDAFQSFRNTQF
jgi:hypothetical protein